MWSRFIVASNTARCPGDLGRPHADAVHLDVIGMAVAAVVVVDREHVGAVPRRGRRASRCAASSTSARAKRSGASFVGSPSIPESYVAEELDAVDAEDPAASIVSATRRSASVSPAARPSVGVCAELAARRDDEHDAVSFGLRARHRAAGGDGFVVGMGVERDERL